MSYVASPLAPAPVVPAAHGPLAGAVPVRSADELRDILGVPHPIVIDKVHDRLIDEDLDLLARSPSAPCPPATRPGTVTSPRAVTHPVSPTYSTSAPWSCPTVRATGAATASTTSCPTRMWDCSI